MGLPDRERARVPCRRPLAEGGATLRLDPSRPDDPLQQDERAAHGIVRADLVDERAIEQVQIERAQEVALPVVVEAEGQDPGERLEVE